MPDASHPIWTLIRMAVVLIALVTSCIYGYESGWSSTADGRMVILTLMSMLGVDIAAHTLGGRK